MSDPKKPSIPAWQRAKPPTTPPADDAVYSQPESNPIETGESLREVAVEPTPAATTPSDSPESSEQDPEPVPSDTTSPTTALHPDALPKPATTATFNTSDFSTYRQQQQQSISPPPSQQRIAPPPIITYPEFLLSAHKPPPLITPGRVITTLYAATGISALLYGANKWLVTPIVASLSESRHDLLAHSTSKVEEFNSRLEKIVSKIPAPPKKEGLEENDDDEESVDSDPTELYHRDMGTQTSDLPSPTPPTAAKKTPVDHEVAVLDILTSHFSELSESSDKVGEAHKDRQIVLNKFRHLLDGMVYNMDGLPTWEAGADGAMTMKPPGGKGDGIEELKKEIRGVKGVLLSARRFPAARAGVAA